MSTKKVLAWHSDPQPKADLGALNLNRTLGAIWSTPMVDRLLSLLRSAPVPGQEET